MAVIICYFGGSKIDTFLFLLLIPLVFIKHLNVLDILENIYYNMFYVIKIKNQQFTKKKSSLME